MNKRVWITIVSLLLFIIFLFPAVNSYAANRDEIEALKQELKAIQEKLKAIEESSEERKDDYDELDDRVGKVELHSATDKVSFSVDFRTRADSIHYQDIRTAPNSVINEFFSAPFNGGTLSEIRDEMSGSAPAPEKHDLNNDVIYTNKFNLNMQGKVNPSLNFMGRISAYKVFGDSTGVNYYAGNPGGDVTLDGNTSTIPHGDALHLERFYFVYKDSLKDIPVSLSLGRRPSTDGMGLEYANYNVEGGPAVATIINWQFDGASVSFNLEEATEVPGASLKFCYGVGYENGWGNSGSLSSSSDVQDVHMGGIIASLYDNETTSAIFNYAHAWNITDGFAGLTVMPFITYKKDDKYYFERNNGGYVSRVEPATNIGDWDAASLLLRTNLTESADKDIDLFLATSWTHTNPSQISKNPFYEIMNQGLLSSNGDLKERDGYSIYAGVVLPVFEDGRLGFEYNWGSQYWFNFTGAEDSLVGSKLAARGSVYETYYINPVFGKNFFVTVGARYYDYDYTGSGNPLGEPVKIDEATAFDTLNPVIDKVLVGYTSATMRF